MEYFHSSAWARHTALLTVALVFAAGSAFGDGSETLGPPSIPISAGSSILAEGVGLVLAQPGIINLAVPAGATVRQVLLYWEGQHSTPAGDNGIVVNGNAVTGTLIGGPDFFFLRNGTLPVYSSTYRADITALNLVTAGVNALSVQGLAFDIANNGAGVMVIVDDGTNAGLQLRDGNDLAYRFFPVPRLGTVPKTYTFDAASVARTARLSMFFSSVQGTVSTGGPQRPNRIAITIGAVTTNYDDVLNSSDGEEWDTWTVDLAIPAGAAQVTVEPLSGPGGDQDPNTPAPRPASFAWLAAGFSLPCAGTIGDFVFRDRDCDGLQGTGDAGIPDVKVLLLSASGQVLDSTRTNAQGFYAFNGLCGGSYHVQVVSSTLPPGLTPTTCSNTPNVANNSNCSPAPVTLPASGSDDLTIDFGYCDAGGGEGCTPGYWKQCHHFGIWTLPYRPSTRFSAVFDNAFPGKTLLQVLKLNGGGLNALGRHTVAALLNSASAGVDYDLTPAQVIAMFNSAYPGSAATYEGLKNTFERLNEQGCPLGRSHIPGAAAPVEESGDEHAGETGEAQSLLRNYPNPFNPTTEVVFQVPVGGNVKIRVFDMLGREVRTLADGWFDAGMHSITWDATDNASRSVVSGVYFAQMLTGEGVQIHRMTLMR
jgi:hypothetical protein